MTWKKLIYQIQRQKSCFCNDLNENKRLKMPRSSFIFQKSKLQLHISKHRTNQKMTNLSIWNMKLYLSNCMQFLSKFVLSLMNFLVYISRKIALLFWFCQRFPQIIIKKMAPNSKQLLLSPYLEDTFFSAFIA